MSTLRTALGVVLPALGLVVAACPIPEGFEIGPEVPTDDDDSSAGDDDDAQHDGFWLQSDAFADGGVIPDEYSCYGDDVSPPLAWGMAPIATASYALMMTDLTSGDCHWAVADIPSPIDGIAGGASPGGFTIDGVTELVNDFYVSGYSGPCTIEQRTYRIELWAIESSTLGLDGWTSPSLLRQAAEAAALQTVALEGSFSHEL